MVEMHMPSHRPNDDFADEVLFKLVGFGEWHPLNVAADMTRFPAEKRWNRERQSLRMAGAQPLFFSAGLRWHPIDAKQVPWLDSTQKSTRGYSKYTLHV